MVDNAGGRMQFEAGALSRLKILQQLREKVQTAIPQIPSLRVWVRRCARLILLQLPSLLIHAQKLLPDFFRGHRGWRAGMSHRIFCRG